MRSLGHFGIMQKYTVRWLARDEKSLIIGELIFAVTLPIGSSNSYAATDKDCLALWKPPIIKVKIMTAVPTINHQISSGQIEKVAKKSGYAKPSEHVRLLGLTNATIGPELGASTKYREVRKGVYCLRLDGVDLNFGARKTVIYIDRKCRESSCAYKVILAHEREHVRINEQITASYLPKVKAELAERAAAIKPFFTRKPDRIGHSLVNRLLFEMAPLLEKFSLAREKANEVIDTNDAYAATQRKCSDW
ncbi:hypothetical protein [Sneathiella sp.]|uniref:hypothetical protein n=1 Tax=Sneathiella sp. TaxID=1964365 RepID=UPI003566F611